MGLQITDEFRPNILIFIKSHLTLKICDTGAITIILLHFEPNMPEFHFKFIQKYNSTFPRFLLFKAKLKLL